MRDSFWSVENNTVSSTIKRDYAISSGNSSAFDGELDLDGLSSNRISSTIGNAEQFDSGIANRTWVIICAIFNKTGNQIAVRVNGSNAFTPVNDYDNALNTNMDLRIFRNRANETMHGQMAEFLTFAAPPGTGGTDISEVERVEGYLAHKWAVQSLLPTTHPYRNYSQASLGDWNPSQGFPIAGGNMDTAFWVDISDGDNHNYNANGHIDSVTDKSGNYTLSMDDDTEIWRSSIGGKYLLAFQGDTGLSTTSTSVQASNGNHWAIGLMRYSSINSVDDAFWHLNSTDGTNRHYSIDSRNSYTSAGWAGETQLGTMDITANTASYNASHAASIIYWNESSSSAQSNAAVGHMSWTIIAMYFNKTGNQIGVRINGTDIITPVEYDNSISTNQEVHLFKNRSGGHGDFLTGDLAEFFTFADIPGTGGTDISFIEIAEGYLAHKWNGSGLGQDILNRLPSDHPFKNSAP